MHLVQEELYGASIYDGAELSQPATNTSKSRMALVRMSVKCMVRRTAKEQWNKVFGCWRP